MRLVYKIINKKPENSFNVKRMILPVLDEKWHYHEEFELIYVLRSSGTLYVGNTVNSYQEGELYFLGSNLPHMKKSDRKEDALPEANEVDLIIIQFDRDFLGKDFLVLHEAKKLNELFHRSLRGIKFPKRISAVIHNELAGLVEAQGLTRVISLLNILHTLSEDKTGICMCSEGFNIAFDSGEKERMVKILEYMTENYHKKIYLEEIAEVANLAPSAFCRYFKKKTRKSFTQYLNEIRIGNACKLLIEGNLQISEVSYISGFSSLCNFNRKFKQVIQATPSEYMKRYSSGKIELT